MTWFTEWRAARRARRKINLQIELAGLEAEITMLAKSEIDDEYFATLTDCKVRAARIRKELELWA